MAGSAWFVATKQTTKSPDCPLGGSCSDEKQIPPPLRWRTDRGQSRHQRHTTTRTAVTPPTTNPTSSLSMGIPGKRSTMCLCVLSRELTAHYSLSNCVDLWCQGRLYPWPDSSGCLCPLSTLLPGVIAVTERYFLHFGRQRWACHKTDSYDTTCICWQCLIIAQKNYRLPLPRTEYTISTVRLHSALNFFLCHAAHWHRSKTALDHSSGCCETAVLWRFLSLPPSSRLSCARSR